MKTLHLITEKILLLTFTLCFAFVCVYVPHSGNKLNRVEAGAATGGSTEVTQILNNVELLGVNAATTASVSLESVTSVMTGNSFMLDNVLDGIAWSLAKSVLSQMTSSMVNWINSGFQGSPAFITDFKGFVTKVADEQFGQYLEELGGPFSFICAPFKLDVRLALSVTYEYQRTNGQNPGKSTACTISGAVENIDKFIEGSVKFVENGGWGSFFKITQNPSALTPIGNILSAQAELDARIVNARGEELKLLDYGSGFLSSKICEAVGGTGAGRKNCTITTPGKVINEALTFQTSAGPRSLIEADEINEIVSALFAQITQQAITGAAGLLGLSAGSGYAYQGVPYTDQLSQSNPSLNPDVFKKLVDDSLAIESEYRGLINQYRPQFMTYSIDLNNSAERRNQAVAIIAEMDVTAVMIQANEIFLKDINTRFTNMMASGVNPTTMQGLVNEYTNNRNLHTYPEVDSKEITWKSFFR